jgi:hypothetical protein
MKTTPRWQDGRFAGLFRVCWPVLLIEAGTIVLQVFSAARKRPPSRLKRQYAAAASHGARGAGLAQQYR